MGGERVQAKVWVRQSAGGQTFYFIDHPPFYDRADLYGERDGDYPDNAERFIFFSKCVVNLARYLPWQPEVLHVHDWQTALVAAFVKDEKARGGWASPPPVCLTIHNLAYQGIFPAAKFALTNLPSGFFQPDGMEFYGGMNCLKAGITCAGMITTVSPRYAREITTEQYGCGLDGVLRQRQDALVGILNGVDYDEWTTVRQPVPGPLLHRGRMAGKDREQNRIAGGTGPARPRRSPAFRHGGAAGGAKGSGHPIGRAGGNAGG